MSPMHDLGLVIFDCDGVLVDSEPISNRVLAEMLCLEGLRMTLPQAREAFQGLRLDGVIAEAERRLGRRLHGGWLAEYERNRADAFRRELCAVAGAADAVQAVLAAGVKACVASQGKVEKTELSLQLTKLDALFSPQALFSGHDVLNGKPHPDLFLCAAAAMSVSPTRCAVVEDTPSGVIAAVSAGMRVLGYAADSDVKALRSAGAQTTFESMRELPALLGLR